MSNSSEFNTLSAQGKCLVGEQESRDVGCGRGEEDVKLRKES